MNDGPVEWNPTGVRSPPREVARESLWHLYGTLLPPRGLLNSVEGLAYPPRRGHSSGPRQPARDPQTHHAAPAPECLQRCPSPLSMDGLSLGGDVEDIVAALGISVVDDLPDYVKAHPLVSKLYIFSPTYLGVLKAIDR